jgi:hypothetical protein
MDKTDKTVKPLNRWILGIFTILAGLFFISIIIQVMLAGFALFVDYGDWNYHRSFIHFFEFVPLVMFILSFIGRFPKDLRWQSAGLYILILLQYVTANLSSSIPYVAVLHPVIAMILFWRSLVTLQQSLNLLKKH